jgi:hypothetical protein
MQHRQNSYQVLSGSHLGNNAAVATVYIHLGSNDIRQNGVPVLNHRRRRLIARGLNAQYFHIQDYITSLQSSLKFSLLQNSIG